MQADSVWIILLTKRLDLEEETFENKTTKSLIKKANYIIIVGQKTHVLNLHSFLMSFLKMSSYIFIYAPHLFQ